MARFALVFLFAFCIFQLSVAAPLDESDISKDLDKGLQSIQNLLKEAFSPENIQKVQDDLKKFGEKLGEQGKALANKANEEIQKMQTPA